MQATVKMFLGLGKRTIALDERIFRRAKGRELQLRESQCCWKHLSWEKERKVRSVGEAGADL